MLIEPGDLGPKDLGCSEGIPHLGMLRHYAQRDGFATCTYQYWGMRLLHWLGIEARILQFEMPSAEIGALLSPQKLDYLECLVQPMKMKDLDFRL
jgi:hypothetical protein